MWSVNIQRSLELPKNRSFFLFGARGTGKSTLVRDCFSEATALRIDLLDLGVESELARQPMELSQRVLALSDNITHVVIDQIQKVPKLLDVVHFLMESKKVPQKFILTGSSARKLKHGGANLLAGSAALKSLFPLLETEISQDFNIEKALRWGTLPAVWFAQDDAERKDFLKSYANIYLKEEIWAEQIVRQMDPFRRFSEIAAKQSGKILNHTSIAADVGVDFKTVQKWYEILADTFIGFHLDSYHTSVRKQLRTASKFYFFDVGVARALAQMQSVKPEPSTSYYGDLFEQFVINQARTHLEYSDNEYKISDLQTKSGVEIDLIVERPGQKLALIEIKSKTHVTEKDVSSLNSFNSDFPDADMFVFSLDVVPKSFGRINALHWAEGLKRL